MTVSIEVITIVASAATLLVALVSGFGWMVNRMDSRFAQQDTRFEARFTSLEARFTSLEARLAGLEHEVTEVKIAVARIEGPPRRFIEAR